MQRNTNYRAFNRDYNGGPDETGRLINTDNGGPDETGRLTRAGTIINNSVVINNNMMWDMEEVAENVRDMGPATASYGWSGGWSGRGNVTPTPSELLSGWRMRGGPPAPSSEAVTPVGRAGGYTPVGRIEFFEGSTPTGSELRAAMGMEMNQALTNWWNGVVEHANRPLSAPDESVGSRGLTRSRSRPRAPLKTVIDSMNRRIQRKRNRNRDRYARHLSGIYRDPACSLDRKWKKQMQKHKFYYLPVNIIREQRKKKRYPKGHLM